MTICVISNTCSSNRKQPIPGKCKYLTKSQILLTPASDPSQSIQSDNPDLEPVPTTAAGKSVLCHRDDQPGPSSHQVPFHNISSAPAPDSTDTTLDTSTTQGDEEQDDESVLSQSGLSSHSAVDPSQNTVEISTNKPIMDVTTATGQDMGSSDMQFQLASLQDASQTILQLLVEMKAAKEKGDVIDKIVDTVSNAHENLNVLDFTKVKSISSLIKRPRVKDVFFFAPLDVPHEDLASIDCGFEDAFEVGTECWFVCRFCPQINGRPGIHIIDKNYTCSHYDNQEQWFKRLKKSIKRHVLHETHIKRVKEQEESQEKIKDKVDTAKRAIRYLVYYLLKSNTAFIQYPTLLGTVFQCGLLIGDINHSRKFASRILPLIDTVLQSENTKEWLIDQQHVSVSLDIGTCMGLVLLVVYFIGSDGKARLAGCELTSKKEGEHCAELCFRIAKSNIFIDENLLIRQVNAIVADGAFVDGTIPFKDKIKQLFRNQQMVFRWDLLHLTNRAHIAARGLTQVDMSQLQDGGNTTLSTQI